MCGIAGVSEITPTTRRMIPFLLWEIEQRGKDSWGATDGENVIKVLGPVTESFHEYEDRIFEWGRGIFHTRSASQGVVSVENQHPFVFVEGSEETGGPGWLRTIVGIHNGCLTNHQALNMKYSREFEVDSMHIFKHLAEGKSMGEIHGWGNLAWYEYSPSAPDGDLHLLRFNHTNALHIARLETGELVFCSYEGAISRAAKMAGTRVKPFYSVVDEFQYTFRKQESGVWEVFKTNERTPFGTRHVSSIVTVTGGGDHGYGYGNNRHWPRESGSGGRGGYVSNYPNTSSEKFKKGLCAITGCGKLVKMGNRDLALVCEGCFDMATTFAKNMGVHV